MFSRANILQLLNTKTKILCKLFEQQNIREFLWLDKYIQTSFVFVLRHYRDLKQKVIFGNDYDFWAWFFSAGFLPARYILALLGSIGMAIIYGLKVNLSVAMVAMLNHTIISQTSHEALNGTSSSTSSGEESCQRDDSHDALEVEKS